MGEIRIFVVGEGHANNSVVFVDEGSERASILGMHSTTQGCKKVT